MVPEQRLQIIRAGIAEDAVEAVVLLQAAEELERGFGGVVGGGRGGVGWVVEVFVEVVVGGGGHG